MNSAHRRTIKESLEITEAMLYTAIRALQTIHQSYGEVCDNFELCHHRACHSSYGAWETSNIALERMDKIANKGMDYFEKPE